MTKERYQRRMAKLASTRLKRKTAKRLRWIKRGGSAVNDWLYGKGEGFRKEHQLTNRVNEHGVVVWVSALDTPAPKPPAPAPRPKVAKKKAPAKKAAKKKTTRKKAAKKKTPAKPKVAK